MDPRLCIIGIPWKEREEKDKVYKDHLGTHRCFCERWLEDERRLESRIQVATMVDACIHTARKVAAETGKNVEVNIVFMCACLCWFQTKSSSKLFTSSVHQMRGVPNQCTKPRHLMISSGTYYDRYNYESNALIN